LEIPIFRSYTEGTSGVEHCSKDCKKTLGEDLLRERRRIKTLRSKKECNREGAQLDQVLEKG